MLLLLLMQKQVIIFTSIFCRVIFTSFEVYLAKLVLFMNGALSKATTKPNLMHAEHLNTLGQRSWGDSPEVDLRLQASHRWKGSMPEGSRWHDQNYSACQPWVHFPLQGLKLNPDQHGAVMSHKGSGQRAQLLLWWSKFESRWSTIFIV